MVNEKDVMRKLKYFAGIAAALMLWAIPEPQWQIRLVMTEPCRQW